MIQQQEIKQGPWLIGWRDVIANLQVLPNCIKLIDVYGNSNYNIVIADQTGRLISYKGTNIENQTGIGDKPVGITYFQQEQSTIMIPTIAMASGPYVFMYRGFRSFYRFGIPKIEMIPEEALIWQQFKPENIKIFVKKLEQLKASDAELSSKSLEILGYASYEKQIEVATQQIAEGYSVEDSITCIDSYKKNLDDEFSIAQLLIGTEKQWIYMLNQNAISIQKSVRITGTPIQIIVTATNDSEFRLAVLIRENRIIFVKNVEFQEPTCINLEAKPISMLRQENNIFVAMMNQNLACYNTNPQKIYQLKMNHSIICIESLEYGRSKNVKGILVALKNKTINFYIEKNLINVIELEHTVTAMKFGICGREDGFLIIIDDKGAIETRILQRQFNAQSMVNKSVVIRNQEKSEAQQIQIPKKTKLFIEQTLRERDQGSEIHRSFQYDLIRMRAMTSQVYLQLLQNDNVPNIIATNNKLRFIAQVEGLGPQFKILCSVENLSQNPVSEIYVSCIYNEKIIKILQKPNRLDYLLPNVQQHFSIRIININPQGQSDQFRVFLFDKQKTQPIAGALVQLPVSEVWID